MIKTTLNYPATVDQQIHAICDALAGDAGFMAQQLRKRAGEVARGQAVAIKAKSALAECARYHKREADRLGRMRHGEYGFKWDFLTQKMNTHMRFCVACSEADEQ